MSVNLETYASLAYSYDIVKMTIRADSSKETWKEAIALVDSMVTHPEYAKRLRDPMDAERMRYDLIYQLENPRV